MEKIIKKGYKLFECDTDGNLYPLFIDKNTPYKMGEWIKAEIHPTTGFSCRPGIHCSDGIPAAPWLMSIAPDGSGYYKGRRKNWKRVWVEVEYNATVDYNPEVQKLKKKCFEDRLPENGYYLFKECAKATWVITDSIRIVGVLSEDRRQAILRAHGYDEQKAFEPRKMAMMKRKAA